MKLASLTSQRLLRFGMCLITMLPTLSPAQVRAGQINFAKTSELKTADKAALFDQLHPRENKWLIDYPIRVLPPPAAPGEPIPEVNWGVGIVESERCPNEPLPIPKCSQRLQNAIDTGCKEPATGLPLSYEVLRDKKAKGYYPVCYNGELWTWCPCGCFTPDTKILINRDGVDVWQEITQLNTDDALIRLTDGASFDKWETQASSIRRGTQGDEDNALVHIETEGGILNLTVAHGVLLANGSMVQAQDLKASDVLVDVQGHPVKILKLERLAYNAKVYNVETTAESNVGHIIFANGLAVGDLAWQNQLEDELYQIQVRE